MGPVRAGERRRRERSRITLVRSARVVQIIALVKPFRAHAVLAALESLPVLAGLFARRWDTGGRRTGCTSTLAVNTIRRSCPRWSWRMFVRGGACAGRDQGDRGPGANRADR